jgi:hypothetical protein
LDKNTKLFLGDDLRFVETRLRSIKDILKSTDTDMNFLLYSVKNNLDPLNKAKIHQNINDMLREIRQIKEKFGLEHKEENLKRKIDTNLDEIWTTLLDTRPEKMRGRGIMSKPDEESVSSHVSKLLRMTEHLIFNKPI